MLLVTAVSAAAYLNISRTTLTKLVREKKLSRVERDGKFFYRIKDLDKAKAFVGKYEGKRGRPHNIERVFNKDMKNIALLDQEQLAEGVLDNLGIDPSMDQRQAEQLLRQQFTHMAAKNKVVQRLFAMLESPSEQTQLKALAMIKDIVLPNRKEVTHTPDEEWKESVAKMDELLGNIHKDITLLSGPPPTVIDGEVVPTIPQEATLPNIEVDDGFEPEGS